MFRNLMICCLVCSLVLGLGLGNFSYANLDPSPDTNIANPTPGADINPNNYLPRVGEVLDYDLWVKSIIHGGKQTVKILSQEQLGDRNVIHVQCAMWTIGLVRSLAKYSETEDLTLDRDGLYPLTIRREVHNGSSTTIDNLKFDYDKGVATRTYCVDAGNDDITEFKLPGFVQDAVSLQFFLRKGDFHDGMNKLYYYENGTVDETSFSVSKVNQALTLRCGTYPNYDRIDHRDGKITVLVSRDTYHLPLEIKVLASFGKVEAILTKIQ